MEPIRFCTLTGVDEDVDMARLLKLSRRYELAEWGVLYSSSRSAEHNGGARYPSAPWIHSFLKEIEAAQEESSDLSVNLALHLCGKDAVNFLSGDDSLMELIGHFGRVQINIAPSALESLDFDKLERRLHYASILTPHQTRFIFQEGERNAQLISQLKGKSGIEVLFDSSGGRGVARAEWPNLTTTRTFGSPHGYAGGLGPDNIEVEIAKISAAADGKPYWIDMETKLRNVNDVFDLDACEKVLETVTRFAFDKSLHKGDHFDQAERPMQDVAALEDFWLDWWSGAAAGFRMAIPPEDAARPMTFSRAWGRWAGCSPTEDAHRCDEILDDSNIGVVKHQGEFIAVGDSVQMSGDTRKVAMLRARVADAFGTEVPINPCHHPKIQASWFGEEFVEAKASPRVAP